MTALALGCSPSLDLRAPADGAAPDGAPADRGVPADAAPRPPRPDAFDPWDAAAVADLGRPDLAPADRGPLDASPDGAPADAAAADLGLGPPAVVEGPGSPGTHDGTRWTDDGLTLEAGRMTGTFVSDPRPVPTGRQWARLRWAPAAPYGHPLASAGEPLVDFPEATVSQADLRLLLHLDDPEPRDAGPLGVEIQAVGGREVAGVFRDGWRVPGSDRLVIPAEAVRFGDDDFTWASFARITPCGDRNGVLLGGESVGRLRAHAWLGCQADDPCPGVGLGGTFRASSGQTTDACAGPLPDDDAWHHVAVVKQGHGGRLRFYVDGAPVHSAATDYSGHFDLDRFFTVGAFDDSFPLTASLDELALWRRALSDRELASLAVRGLARAEIAVRVCATVDACADAGPFARLEEQPGGAGFWVDELPGAEPVLQYRVTLSRQAGAAPVVRAIILEAD